MFLLEADVKVPTKFLTAVNPCKFSLKAWPPSKTLPSEIILHQFPQDISVDAQLSNVIRARL